MKKRSLVLVILINVIPLILLSISVSEIVEAYYNPGRYPFGSEFFSPYSVYKSSRLYITYQIVFSISLLALILSSIRWNKLLYYTLLAINLIIFLYPLLTNQ